MRRTAPALLLATALASGCARERATRADCDALFGRIVEIELLERGFRDPALLERKRQELRRALSGDLAACEGKPLPAGALACARDAATAEEVSHRCLRAEW